jgi:hypothetical protein
MDEHSGNSMVEVLTDIAYLFPFPKICVPVTININKKNWARQDLNLQHYHHEWHILPLNYRPVKKSAFVPVAIKQNKNKIPSIFFYSRKINEEY